MTEQGEWERRLSELLTIASGEPRRDVSIAMVRRRLVRRRVSIAAATAAVAVVLGGIGAVAASASGGLRGPAPGVLKGHGVPGFYMQSGAGHPLPVVRSRTTGAITATIRCPWARAQIVGTAAAAANRTFYFVCLGAGGESRIYRLRLTGSGRVRGYSRVRGGTFNRSTVGPLAVTPDGATIAVGVASLTGSGAVSDKIVVIRTRTGARAQWGGNSEKPGTIFYPVDELSLTANGNEVVLLTMPRCVARPGGQKCHVAGGEQVRALAVTSRGGKVSDSRLLVKQADLMRIAIGYINDAVVGPDGSLVTLTEVGWPQGHVSIVRVSAATGKQVGVVYRLKTGRGRPRFYAFAADPSVRYFILEAGPAKGPLKNGWTHHRRLIPLWPRDGSGVAWEAW